METVKPAHGDIQEIVVSAIVQRDDGKILLAKRPQTKKVAPGKYHLPGGHVEFGESLEQALIREMEEEFQLHVTPRLLLRSFTYTHGNVHTIGITMTTEPNPVGEPLYFDPQDTECIVWVTKNDFMKYLDSSDHDFLSLQLFFQVYG